MNVNSPLVSVIIPLYNHENYIQTTIESILNQNYPSIEVIVVDDGSTDNSALVVDKIIANTRISIKFIKKQNEGISKTLNLGIRSSKGDYICFVASDDYLLPDSIRSRVDYLNYHTNKLAVFGDAVVVDSTGDELYPSAIEDLHNGRKQYLKINKLLPLELIFKWCVPGPVLMVKKSLFELIGLFDENLMVEDWDFYLRVASKDLLGYLDEDVAAYRLHDSNCIKQRNEDRFIFAIASTISKSIENYDGLAKLKLIGLKLRRNIYVPTNSYLKRLYLRGLSSAVNRMANFSYTIYAKTILWLE